MPQKIETLRLPYFRLAGVAIVLALCVYWGYRQFKYQTSPIVPDRRAIVEETIELMRSNSIVSSQVDWTALQTEAISIADRTGNEMDLDTAILYLASSLRDGHSTYFSRAQSESFNAAEPEKSISSITGEVSEVDGVPRVSVNGFLSTDAQFAKIAAQKLRDQVEKAIEGTNCGVIVDLTENSGGNMYPMLSGLLPLLSDGILLQFESAAGSRTAVRSNVGAIDYGSQEIFPPVRPKQALVAKRVPTAVIFGPSTGSAGELVAIAFKTRSDVRSFGQPTAGVVTGNTPYKLKNGGLLALATSWTLDSRGRKYTEPLTPDESIVGINAASKARKRAAVWVRSQCGMATH